MPKGKQGEKKKKKEEDEDGGKKEDVKLKKKEEGGGKGKKEEKKKEEDEDGGASAVTSGIKAVTLTKEKVTCKEVEKVFMVSSEYGVEGGWPHETIMVLRMTYPGLFPGQEVTLLEKVYRNIPDTMHAEICFLKDKEVSEKMKQAPRKVTLDAISNFSPCSKCAGEIVQFLQSCNKVSKFKMLFSNLYYIIPCDRNGPIDAFENQEGLGLLNEQPNVELKTFEDENDWKTLLKSALVYMTADEKTALLAHRKPERVEREKTDKEYLDHIRDGRRNTQGEWLPRDEIVTQFGNMSLGE